ncbi:hypothetical protein RSPO_m00988 (plasmid) [Ralstonia solanacearum Po82]|uniref:Uncharacterized protein n=1 Tax=Ralstonia solanacearum (strain Po82) TaxID=1031711 RepID=F6GAB0_RALS8|nr:hypothetical protein RSPO_m00988 [Ralstonia solanacearum Po82]
MTRSGTPGHVSVPPAPPTPESPAPRRVSRCGRGSCRH